MKTGLDRSTCLLFALIFVPVCGLLAAGAYFLANLSDFLNHRLSSDFPFMLITIAVISGLAIGIPIGLWAGFRDRIIKITVEYDDQRAFLQYANAMLQDDEFRISYQDDKTCVYKEGDFFVTTIRLELDRGVCTITGPRPHLEEMQNRLAQARLTGDYSIEAALGAPAPKPATETTETSAADTGATPTIPVIPSTCPKCLAPITLDSVRWTGPLSAACPSCGTGIDVEWRKIG